MGIPTMGMKTTDMKVLCYSRISSAKRTVPFPQGILINLSDTCEEPVPEGILIDLSNSSDVPIQGVDPKGLSDELDTLVTEVEDLIDLSDKSDASKTPPMEAVALRSPSPSTPSNNVIRGSSSSRVTSTSSTQPPRGDLPDLANLVHLATNRQKEVLFLMHEPRRLAPAHMGVSCLQMRGSPFSGPPVVQIRAQNLMMLQRVYSQKIMANQEATGFQTWTHVGFSAGHPPTL